MRYRAIDLWLIGEAVLFALKVIVYGRWFPSCVMWCIWRENNDPTFKNCEKTKLEVKDVFCRTHISWMVALCLLFLVIRFLTFSLCFA